MDKQKIAAKIAALRNKTVENGASEEEAMAAAIKAHELLTKYQIEFGTVEIRAQGIVQRDTPKAMTLSGIRLSDKNLQIKWFLAGDVGEYCDCKVWGPGTATDMIRFMGLPSDVEFALWLLDSLALFTVGQLGKHMATFPSRENGPRWQAKKAFSFGCCARINAKLQQAKPQEAAEQAKTSGGRDLMVVKNQLVEQAYEDLGLNLKFSRGRSYRDPSSYGAGYAAGEGASIGRPINGNGEVRRLR